MRRLHTITLDERLRIRDRLAAELATVPNIAFVYLYGSFAESERFHDVDVGVYLRNGQPDRDAASALALAERLGGRLNMPVDVRILNSAPVSFLYHVLKGELLLSTDDDLLANIIEATTRRYLDIEPLLRRSAKEVFAA